MDVILTAVPTRADRYSIVAGRWSNAWVGWVHAVEAAPGAC